MKVRIKRELYSKLVAYAKLCDVELGGMGKAKIVDGEINITNIYLVKQQAHGTTCELDPVDLGRLEYDARNDDGEMFVWWHSHVNMGVGPSGQDTKTMESIAANGRCLMLIVNKKGECHVEFMSKGDEALFIPAFRSDATLSIIDAGIDKAALKAEIKAMVLPFVVNAPNIADDQTINSFGDMWDRSIASNRAACLDVSHRNPMPANSSTIQSRSWQRSRNESTPWTVNHKLFEVQDSIGTLRLASGYVFLVGKDNGAVSIGVYHGDSVRHVAYSTYLKLTDDKRESVKKLVQHEN